jgi:outer membrane murein-binding lipoprotein Lpp
MDMTLTDYAALREIEEKERHRNSHDGWGSTTALWVIAAVILIVAIVYCWTRNCNEKVQFATGLANLNGRVQCMEPDVKWLGQQMYGVAQTAAGIVTGVADINRTVDSLGKTVYQYPVDNLTARMIAQGYATRSSGCGCGNNRVFEQTQNYTLASQGVTVTERCGNDRC